MQYIEHEFNNGYQNEEGEDNQKELMKNQDTYNSRYQLYDDMLDHQPSNEINENY